MIQRRIVWLLAALISLGALTAVPIPQAMASTEVAVAVSFAEESCKEQIPREPPRRLREVASDVQAIAYQTAAKRRIFSNSLYQRPPPLTPLA